MDNGPDPMGDLLPVDNRINYYLSLGKKQNHGELMNQCMKLATGEICIVWDDDDWYAPDRISRQVKPFENPGIDIVGTGSVHYYAHGTQRAFHYHNHTTRKWMAAPAFRKSVWEKMNFEHIPQGADTIFMNKIPPERWLDLDDPTLLISAIHPNNAAPKRLPCPSFVEMDWRIVERITKGTLYV